MSFHFDWEKIEKQKTRTEEERKEMQEAFDSFHKSK